MTKTDSKTKRTSGPLFSLQAGLVVVLVAGFVLFAAVAHHHYPVQRWLFWRYLAYWALTLLWGLGCWGVGSLSLRSLFGRPHGAPPLPLLEWLSLCLVVGVFEFELVMFGLGLLRLFKPFMFVAAPVATVVAGGTALLQDMRHVQKWLRRLSRSPNGANRLPAQRAFRWAIVAFGVVGLLMIYFIIITPHNVQFDARWKHLALAEDFVAHGGVHPFSEGWVFGARPHMVSLLYSWAFLWPNSLLFDRMLLCAHVEFLVFAATTVVAIPALVRRLVPRANFQLVWAARFLFPGVFVYDSAPSAGTDHIGASLAVPIALATLYAWRRLEPKWCAVLGFLLASALTVKETIALLLIPFPVLLIAVRVAQQALRTIRGAPAVCPARHVWLGPLVSTGVILLFSAPLWLANLIWHGDPMYPLLYRYFDSKPWSDYASYKMRYGKEFGEMWAPDRNLAGLLQTVKALFTFSFIPNDWPKFHGKVPVFGSLFTLLLFALLFVRRSKRTWLLVLWIHVGLFTWYSVHHQDRYLQGIMPLIAAATAAMLILIWRQGSRPAKVALCSLVGLQIVWGADAYFFPTHAMAGSVVKKTVDLLGAGYKRNYEKRFRIQEDFQDLGRALPDGSRVLIHDTHSHLGVRVERALDTQLWQYGFDYGAQRTPAEMYAHLRSFGITHIAWPGTKSRGQDTIAGDLMFYDFVNRRLTKRRKAGSFRFGQLPAEPPTGSFDDRVVVINCRRGLRSGLYRVHDLYVPVFGPKRRELPKPRKSAPREEASSLASQANFAVVDPHCGKRVVKDLSKQFKLVARRKLVKKITPYEIWLRRGERHR